LIYSYGDFFYYGYLSFFKTPKEIFLELVRTRAEPDILTYYLELVIKAINKDYNARDTAIYMLEVGKIDACVFKDDLLYHYMYNDNSVFRNELLKELILVDREFKEYSLRDILVSAVRRD
jgi:hypothetical protein